MRQMNAGRGGVIEDEVVRVTHECGEGSVGLEVAREPEHRLLHHLVMQGGAGVLVDAVDDARETRIVELPVGRAKADQPASPRVRAAVAHTDIDELFVRSEAILTQHRKRAVATATTVEPRVDRAR